MEGLTEEEAKEHNLSVLGNHWYDDCAAVTQVVLEDGTTIDWRKMNCTEKGNDGDQLPCLGVPLKCVKDPEFINLVALSPEYSKLPRPVRIPGKCPIVLPVGDAADGLLLLREGHSPAAGDESQSQTQAVILNYWNGDFVFNCQWEPDFPNFLVVNANTCLTESGTDALLSLTLETPPSGKGMAEFQSNLVIGNSDGVFDRDEVHLLGGRVLHHFLRQHGSNLPLDFLLQSLTCLQNLFKTRDYFEAGVLLDLALIRSDCYSNCLGFDREGQGTILNNEVGAVLEAMGLQDEAALLYQEVVRLFLPEDVVVISNAADSFLKADRLEEALEVTLQGLELVDVGISTWNFDTADIPKSLLCTLLDTQHELAKSSRIDETSGLFWMTLQEKIWMGLAGLAGLAKFEHDEPHALVEQAAFWSNLKSKFHKPKEARKALKRILRSGTVSNYVSGVLSVLKQDEFQIKIVCQELRNHRVCTNCGKEETEVDQLLWCTCRRVPYCSKECQKSDWARHKPRHKLHMLIVSKKEATRKLEKGFSVNN